MFNDVCLNVCVYVHIVMLFIVYMSVSFCRTYACNCYVRNKYSAVIVLRLVMKCWAMHYAYAQDVGGYYKTLDAVLGCPGDHPTTILLQKSGFDTRLATEAAMAMRYVMSCSFNKI